MLLPPCLKCNLAERRELVSRHMGGGGDQRVGGGGTSNHIMHSMAAQALEHETTCDIYINRYKYIKIYRQKGH